MNHFNAVHTLTTAEKEKCCKVIPHRAHGRNDHPTTQPDRPTTADHPTVAPAATRAAFDSYTFPHRAPPLTQRPEAPRRRRCVPPKGPSGDRSSGSPVTPDPPHTASLHAYPDTFDPRNACRLLAEAFWKIYAYQCVAAPAQ